ncbi:MAG: L-fucose:H+ symporter permease [Bacteroidales bacterium]|nr:L-fucose:H+ symporter permease [Bacteroidales bacterium]
MENITQELSSQTDIAIEKKSRHEKESLFVKDGVNYLVPFILVTSLFFIWGLANNMTDTLLSAFREIMSMSSLQTSFIQMSFYGAYFCFALPAALFIRKYSYKSGIVLGLLMFATGGFLFYPAGSMASYPFYLIAIYILAAGCSILETTANPFILSMGPEETSTRRLNFAQSFNPIGSITGLLISKYFILSALATDTERDSMSEIEILKNQSGELFAVSAPYMITGLIMFAVMAVFIFYPLPKSSDTDKSSMFEVLKRLLKNKHYSYGVVTQFFYVGAQICTWSYLIQYICSDSTLTPEEASTFSVISLALFTGARFLFTYLMKFFKPALLLSGSAVMAVLCTAIVIFSSGTLAIIAIIGISFFMSLMFPTIYGIALKGIGEDAKVGASGLIMAILGGALFPIIQGWIATKASFTDPLTGEVLENFKLSYIVPFVCFVVVLFYGMFSLKNHRE